jgi:hypothetical protein
MKFKKILFGMVIATVMAMVFAPVIMSGIANQQTSLITNNIEIKPSSTVTLKYNFYKEAHDYSNDRIEWEYETNNTQIGLTVWAMDEDDFIDYKASREYYKYILYSSFFYKKSGTWTANHDDTWYILFINNDANQKTVYVTYSVEFGFDWFDEYGYIAIPVGIVIFIAIAAGISKSQQQARARTQARSRAQASTESSPYKVQRAPAQEKKDMFGEIGSKPAKSTAPPPVPVEVKTGPPKICELCGEETEADLGTKFCPHCGGKFEK